MTRDIHAQNDLLTSFDLRGHNFRVDVEFATYNHGHTQNNIFRAKRLLSDIFQPKQQFIFRVLPKVPFFIWILGCRFRHWIIHNCLLLFKDMLLTWHLFQGILNRKIPDTNTVGTGEFSTLENIYLRDPNIVDLSSATNCKSGEGARDVDNIWDSAIQSLFFSQRQVISENKPFYIFVLLHSAQYCNKIIIQHFHSNC